LRNKANREIITVVIAAAAIAVAVFIIDKKILLQ
jgi:hypothetical protein